MATQRSAELKESRAIAADTRLLSLELSEDDLGFVGGQYVIVDTQIPLPNNKVAKRAYSIVSSDREQRRFEIAVRRIGVGPASNYLNGLEVGARVPFSGPWGKFLADSTGPAEPSTLVCATDTGITAALGLLAGREFSGRNRSVEVVWMMESAEYFPRGFVEERLAALPGAPSLHVLESLPIGHPERQAWATSALRPLIAGLRFDEAFLSGDGAVLASVKAALIAASVAPERIRSEPFFNNPERRAS